MEPFTLFSLFCLVAGAILAWVIRKLVFEKNHVSIQELEVWKQKYQEANTAKAVNESLLTSTREDLQKATAALEARGKEVEKLIGQLSDKTTECGNLELDKNDLRVEINNLKTEYQSKVEELQKATSTVVGLQENLKYAQDKLDTQKTEIENIGQKFGAEFRVLASSILDDKSKKFTEHQEANLKSVLQPVNRQRKVYR
jgi:DNA recombination protein RmuC